MRRGSINVHKKYVYCMTCGIQKNVKLHAFVEKVWQILHFKIEKYFFKRN